MLIDEVVKMAVAGSLGLTREGVQELLAAEVIEATNVCEYTFAVSDQEHFHLDVDFPNIAPPFPSMFIEYKGASQIRSKEKGPKSWDPSVQALGMWITSFETPAEDLAKGISQGAPDHKWVCVGHPFAKVDGITRMGGFTIGWCVTAEGEFRFPIEGPDGGLLLSVYDESLKGKNIDATPFLVVPFMTLCFMHCKNVVMRKVDRSLNFRKEKVRKKRMGLIRSYSVLEIKPMQQILSAEGGGETNGMVRAMHICRGHFKDFSKGSGLFGKYRGVYWWEMQTRGSASAGIHEKDYAVDA